MTLIIALACDDGPVLVADGQINRRNSRGIPLYSQRGGKIRTGSGRVFWAGAGDVSALQALDELVTSAPEEAHMDLQEMVEWLQPRVPKVHDDFRKRRTSGPEAQGPPPKGDLLLVENHGGQARIATMGSRGDYEFHEQNGIGAIGRIHFVAHMRGRRHDISKLSWMDGAVLGVSTLRDVIDAGIVDVGDPLSVWTAPDEEDGTPRPLTEDEIRVVEERYEKYEEDIRQARESWIGETRPLDQLRSGQRKVQGSSSEERSPTFYVDKGPTVRLEDPDIESEAPTGEQPAQTPIQEAGSQQDKENDSDTGELIPSDDGRRMDAEIIHTLLEAVDGCTKKTHVMQEANVSHSTLDRYLSLFQASDLVNLKGDGPIELTDEGRECHQLIEESLRLLGDDAGNGYEES